MDLPKEIVLVVWKLETEKKYNTQGYGITEADTTLVTSPFLSSFNLKNSPFSEVASPLFRTMLRENCLIEPLTVWVPMDAKENVTDISSEA
jgi:hypothetical protein